MLSLKNQILISSPNMLDSFFSKSIIYVCEHNQQGAMGLIINKKLRDKELYKKLLKVLQKNKDHKLLKSKIYFGGPVLIENGIVLHHSSYKSKESIPISDSISITSNQKTLNSLIEKKDALFKIILGHAGWSKGQLEKEIENGDWLIQKTEIDFIFNVSPGDMWLKAIESLGLDTECYFGVAGKT
tara:strand:- start:114 stop:668 length:555 start_codon:yes stop_codon:yes gene_type:complete